MSVPANWRYLCCPTCRSRSFGPDGSECPFGHGQMRPVPSEPERKVGTPDPSPRRRKRSPRRTPAKKTAASGVTTETGKT